MKKLAMVILAAVVLVGCTSQPIYTVESRPVPLTAQQYPLERIEALIVEAGQKRNWKFERVAPGHLVAMQIHPKHSATVDVIFDQKTYRITYKSSVGFDEQNGTIHRRYNTWVRNLERDIDTRLTNAALTKR